MHEKYAPLAEGIRMNTRRHHHRAITRHILATCLLAALLLAGCHAPPEPTIKGIDPLLIRPTARRNTIGTSVENRPIETIVLGNGPDVVLIMATIHGNEPAGTPLVEMLAAHIEKDQRFLTGRTVVLMPLTNPDGLAANTRANARGVDLNRNFAADNRQDTEEYGMIALSEPESRAISQVITMYHPNRIISIHQPLNCIDYDGPAEKLAAHMANWCDLPVRKLGARPGSLGAYAGEMLNIPVITMELKPSDHTLSQRELWRRYGGALLAAVLYPGPAPRTDR